MSSENHHSMGPRERDIIGTALGQVNAVLAARTSLEAGLIDARGALSAILGSIGDDLVREDLQAAIDAIERLAEGNKNGVTQQYLRLVNTTQERAQSPRVFFTLWNRNATDAPEPCIVYGRVNSRNIELLKATRTDRFVRRIADRLGETNYSPAILLSKVQGFEVLGSAGVCPQVLFADFVNMAEGHNLDPATAGGIVFDSFGDSLLDHIFRLESTFPDVVRWLGGKGVLNHETIHRLTVAHVLAHDLCGHSIPYDLRNPTRCAVDWYLRAPLEEMYADTHAMWIYSAPATRDLLADVLTEDELDAIPVLIVIKRIMHYARLSPEDHDARCSWMMFDFWRKAGLIQEGPRGLKFDLDMLPRVVDSMLSELLEVERAIGKGPDSYDAACRDFTFKYGSENVSTHVWEMPRDLAGVFASAGA